MKRILLLCIAGAAFVLPVHSAAAAVTLGSDLAQEPSDGVFCAAACSWVQSALPGRVTDAPVDGVIVRWRIKTNAPGGPFALHVARPAGGNSRSGIATSTFSTIAAAGISEFPTRLPVKQGDNFGIRWTAANTADFKPSTGVPGAVALYFQQDLPDGETKAPGIANTNTEFLVNADLEPDLDGDGFGDETQDVCPRAGANGGCASLVPAIKTTFAKRQRLAKLAVTATADRNVQFSSRATLIYRSGKRTRSIRSKNISRQAAADVRTRLAYKFTRTQRATVKRVLAEGKRVAVKVTVTAVDGKALKTVANVSLRLKR